MKVLSPFLLVAFCVMLAVALICIAVFQSAQSRPPTSALMLRICLLTLSAVSAVPVG